MGCSASRLEDEEAVQLCRDRRNFIKEAVEQRIRFASGHIAYIQSLQRVSQALHSYVDGDEYHEFFPDSFMTPPFKPVKRLSPGIIEIPLKSISTKPIQSETSTIHVARYLRSSGNPSVSVEEWPQSPETVRIDSYYPMYPSEHYANDGFFTSQASPINSSFFSSPYNRPSYPPPSPQNQQWDFFWNPFSSLDTYGYTYRSSLDHMISDDDVAGLRRVREEEGIPELEEEGSREEDDEEEEFMEVETEDDPSRVDSEPTRVTAATVDPTEVNPATDAVREMKGLRSNNTESIEVTETHKPVELEVAKEKEVTKKSEAAEETPGFTVYLNRRPTSIVEAMKDIEDQFMRICESAHEISVMLEASRAQYSSNSSEVAVRMLNPVALFRSTSSRSSSSRFLHASSSSRYDGYESSSDYSEESCMISGSHQSTLDRLYAWEKKLYEEVKAGERLRIAYEKKCMQLRNQDVNGDEPSAVDKTRAAIRDLHTRLKISIHSVESVSKRIETLRDEELHPQLMELIQGLTRMWRTMADCHRIQKRTTDEAKLLLLSSAAAAAAAKPTSASPRPPPRSAAHLEAELRHWRHCHAAWIAAQRSYARALAGWALRCATAPDAAASGRSPRRSSSGEAPPPAFAVCVQWSRLLDSVSEAPVMDGLDFFAAGIGSVWAQQQRREEDGVETATAEKAAEMAGRVLWAGMAVAASSLAEFAGGSAEAYEGLVKRLGNSGKEGRAES